MCKSGSCNDGLPVIFNRFFGNELFNNIYDGDVPAVNIKESDKEYVIDMMAAGYKKEDFNVKVNKSVLTISAKHSEEKEDENKDHKVIRREFSSSSFSRSFTLPEHVDTEHIEAEQSDGVLKIKLPKLDKAKEDKIKKIDIK